LIDHDVCSQQLLIQEIETLFLEKLSIRIGSADEDLFQTGTLDSVAMVRLLLHLEEHFGVRLPMEDLGADSFRSVEKIAELVGGRMAASKGPAANGVSLSNGNGTILTSPKPAEQGDLVSEIQALFLDKLDIRIESPDADLFQSGVFDSMTLVEFILGLEEHFGLPFPMEELELDSVLSVVKIAELVASRKQAAAAEVF
jgi:acyl carrier protein